MDINARCKHCTHFDSQHGEDGRCNFRHKLFRNGAECDCPGYERRTRITTPVPAEHLQAIGQITVNFALLEGEISSFIGVWLSNEEWLGHAVTSELPFRKLAGLLSSIYREMAEKPEQIETLDDLLKRAFIVEEKRNIITHSLWRRGNTPQTIIRIKRTAKVSKGLRHQKEELSVDDLNRIAEEIAEVAHDIEMFAETVLDGY